MYGSKKKDMMYGSMVHGDKKKKPMMKKGGKTKVGLKALANLLILKKLYMMLSGQSAKQLTI